MKRPKRSMFSWWSEPVTKSFFGWAMFWMSAAVILLLVFGP